MTLISQMFEIKDSGKLSKGVFATQLIKQKEQILEFTGPTISFEETLRKPPGTHSHPLQITEFQYIDLEAPGVLVNHSCNPNAKIHKERFLIALRNIHIGEEIFYDYSTTILDEDDWTLLCECGSLNCRHIVGDFRYLPTALQKTYIELDIVQSCIKRNFNIVHSPNRAPFA